MKAVFDVRESSRYNDNIAHFYHFPRKYLPIAQRTVGDWVIYRNTYRGNGTTDYFGTALVRNVELDSQDEKLYYANVDFFMLFTNRVTLKREGTRYWENYIDQIGNPQQVGVRLNGNAMRNISDLEYGEIAGEGFKDSFISSNFLRFGMPPEERQLLNELELSNVVERPRRLTEMLVRQPIRDANFRHIVLSAYGDKCAMTGLRVVNGGGRSEAQAAHILPVAEGGPDTPSNGIALSATCHWLFDRHLVSLDEDYQLLISSKVRHDLRQMNLNEGQKIHLPRKRDLRPNQDYLEQHRSSLIT